MKKLNLCITCAFLLTFPSAAVLAQDAAQTPVQVSAAVPSEVPAASDAVPQVKENGKPGNKAAGKLAAKKLKAEKQKNDKKANGKNAPHFQDAKGGKGFPNFRREFGAHPPFGNPEAVFRTHPEFKKLVEEEFELEKQSRDLARQYKSEKDAGKSAKIESELRTVVDKHFEVRQQRRLYELKLFQERIETMRKQIESRVGKKERIIEQRMEDLIGNDEDLSF